MLNSIQKRTYQDSEKMPLHEFGVYSVAEKTLKQHPVIFQKSPSPPPPIHKHVLSDAAPMRQHNSRMKEAFNKTTEECEWRMKGNSLHKSSQKTLYSGDQNCTFSTCSRRSSGAGDPRAGRTVSRISTLHSQSPQESPPPFREQGSKNVRTYAPITTYRTSQAPVIKSVNEARNYLMRTSLYNSEREKQLKASVTITPRAGVRQQSPTFTSSPVANKAQATPSFDRTNPYSPAAPKTVTGQQSRRRLGRSPSPRTRIGNEQSRATNTPSPSEKFLVKETSKTALKDVLSRLKLSMCRDGSLGAASLGATRDAPAPRRAPSVRSDERPLATQGDMLNSIKLQRRRCDNMNSEKTPNFYEKVSMAPNKNNVIKNEIPKTNNIFSKPNQGPGLNRDKPSPISRSFYSPARPMSPTGRRNAQTNSFY